MKNKVDINSTKYRIMKKWEDHKGEHVISDHAVKRFIAIVDDGEDYYYVLYDGRKIEYSSCVCGLIYLKGKIDDEDYKEFIRLATLNHFDQPTLWGSKDSRFDKSSHEHREQIEAHLTGGDQKLLTAVCWELN